MSTSSQTAQQNLHMSSVISTSEIVLQPRPEPQWYIFIFSKDERDLSPFSFASGPVASTNERPQGGQRQVLGSLESNDERALLNIMLGNSPMRDASASCRRQ